MAIDPTRITTENAPEHHFFGHPKARGEFHITPHPDDVMQQDEEPKKVDDQKQVEEKKEIETKPESNEEKDQK